MTTTKVLTADYREFLESKRVTSSRDGSVVANIRRKERDAETMAAGNIQGAQEATMTTYRTDDRRSDKWDMRLGDCVERTRELPDTSVDFAVFSPPFASLYTYSDSERDMGNSRSDQQFAEHFGFLIHELARVVKDGRLCAVHCMNLPSLKFRDGFIGLKDFRGDIIRAFQSAGWIYHAEVCIWKDPVTQMQRTKALGLLHKTIRKDSSMARMGLPDYVVVFRRPGENAEPIAHDAQEFPVSQWQKWASPVWTDINPSDTLQATSAREHEDERHICPLQLGVIERCLGLWSNPDDLVLSPFAGIGSEGFQAVKMGRRFVGIELKQSYFNQACLNLARAERETRQRSLFDRVDTGDPVACGGPLDGSDGDGSDES